MADSEHNNTVWLIVLSLHLADPMTLSKLCHPDPDATLVYVALGGTSFDYYETHPLFLSIRFYSLMSLCMMHQVISCQSIKRLHPCKASVRDMQPKNIIVSYFPLFLLLIYLVDTSKGLHRAAWVQCRVVFVRSLLIVLLIRGRQIVLMFLRSSFCLL